LHTKDEIIGALASYAPLELADPSDNCGLQVDGKDEVSSVSLILDPSLDALKRCGGDFIFSHHPLFFLPIKRIDGPLAKKLGQLLGRQQTLYSLHTCLDFAPRGVSWRLMDILGLEEVKGESTPQLRIATSGCESIDELSAHVACTLGTKRLKVVDSGNAIGKIGLIPGSGFGPSTIEWCASNGISVLISGDLKYHQAMQAQDLGISLIDAGHRETEYPVLKTVGEYLENSFEGLSYEIVAPELPWDFI